MPTYNRSAELQSSVTSVLSQSYANFELIVVDDGSSDDTQNVLQAFNDPRLRYFYQANKGVCAARNTGIHNSDGNYITFLDSDDAANNDWLMNYFLNLENNPTDIVFCDMNLHNQDGTTKLRKALFRYNQNIPNENGMFMPGTFCIKSDLIKSIGGFDVNIRFGEFTDIDFTLQKMNISRSFTNKVGIHYYPAPNGGGKNQKNKIEAIQYFLIKHKEHFNRDNEAKWLYLQNLAISYTKINDFKSARVYFTQAFFVNPSKFKTLIRLIFSMFPFFARKIWSINISL